jgi:hypothetical protein
MSFSIRITEPFTIVGLNRELGLSEHIIESEITKICNNIANDSLYVKSQINYVSNNHQEIAIYLFMDETRFCLRDVINFSDSPKVTLTPDEFMKTIDLYRARAIELINKHPLGKFMFVGLDNERKTFRYNSRVGEGYIETLSKASFIDKDFESFNLSTWQAYAHLNQYLDEQLLRGSNLTLILFGKNGYRLYLGSANNVNIS